MIAAPAEDLDLATRRKLVFRVMAKRTTGGRWELVEDDVADLPRAISLASRSKAVEAGVFVVSASGGFLYWTSHSGYVFNSLVLHEGYS